MPLPIRTPFALAGHPEIPGPLVYEPVGADRVALSYGNEYRFRVRLMDLTGGGPTSSDELIHQAPAAVTTIPFRRYVAPKAATLGRGGGVSADGLTATYDVFRPDLAYPTSCSPASM